MNHPTITVSSDSPEAIALLGVTRRFGSTTVLEDISLIVGCGELFGLLGPSGSGKTTLVRLLAGLDRADEGTVELFGWRMPKLSLLDRIGYMAQADALYNELTAKENLMFFAALYGLKVREAKRRIECVMDIVKLADHLEKPVHAYSGGMKRRLSLAVALLHEPELLVLDEPTVGIDPVLRQSIWNELAQLQAGGTTILLTTHVMDEAEKCGRLGLIRGGRLIAVASPEELVASTGSRNVEEAFISLGGGTAV